MTENDKIFIFLTCQTSNYFKSDFGSVVKTADQKAANIFNINLTKEHKKNRNTNKKMA